MAGPQIKIDKVKLSVAVDEFVNQSGPQTFNDFIIFVASKGIIKNDKQGIAAVRRALSKEQKKTWASENIDWKIVNAKIQDALKFFASQGVRPTLRTLYYNLVSQNIIGNTKSSYKGLSRYVVELRKSGLVRWDALEDSARKVYGNFADRYFSDDIVEDNEKRLNGKLDEFNAENIIEDFFNYVVDRATVSRWAKQPIVCEFWIEKEALAKTIEAWTQDLGVKIRVNKGYSSWTFLYENCRELKNYLSDGEHEKVKIFYLGDMDPSGLDMERFLNEALNYFNLDTNQVELSRLSVTDDQVRQYNLPPRPDDAETLAKLKRDSRSANYAGEFIVELDSMVAFVPQEFRKLVVNAIKENWNETIYQDLRAKAKEHNDAIEKFLTDIKERAKERMKDL